MLVRSAGRRQQHHQHRTCRMLASSFSQLQLPWLAPAQLQWAASQARRAPLSPNVSRTQNIAGGISRRGQLRSLATATDHTTSRSILPTHHNFGLSSLHDVTPDEHIPFDFSSFSDGAHYRFGGLRRYNEPIIINTSDISAGETIRVTAGVTGLAKDLIGHLRTSLAVGRRDRAEAIVLRMGEQCAYDSLELLQAHTLYLQDMLKGVMLHGRDSPQCAAALKEMQRWFEVEIRAKGVLLDVDLLVPMLRASIRALDGSRRDRSIRRYVEISRELGEDVMEDVLESEEYDDNEFAILGRATTQFYENADVPAESGATTTELVQAVDLVRTRQETGSLADVPEVLATEQKGTGLDSVKKAVETMRKARSSDAYERQRSLEDSSVEVARDRWKKADEDLRRIGIHTSMQSRPIAALMWQWYEALLPTLERELKETKKALNDGDKSDPNRMAYGPYLELLPMKKVAASTILYIMSRTATGKNRSLDKYESEVKITALTVGLAQSIEQECLADIVSKRQSSNSSRRPNNTARLRRQALRALERDIGKPSSVKTKARKANQAKLAEYEWPQVILAKLGSMLVSKFLESARLPVTREDPRTQKEITQMQPAFLHRLKYNRGKKVGLVAANPALMSKLQSEPVGSLIAKRMPMVVEPREWRGWDKGGYLHYTNTILRLQGGGTTSKDYFMAADEKGDLDTLYKGLTALGKVPWKVHNGVFNVQLQAWNSGEAIANFAPLHPDLPVPPEPDSSADPNERKKWLVEIRELGNKKNGLHSKRCFQNFQMEVARTFLNEKMYFPHSLDFRGRAYPIPPYLNHMGADNVRGLLVFADGKELGETGLQWLKIHLATVAGHDKASIEERVEFTMEHLDDIYDSVRNPLDGRRWWLQAEDAWQTLAACFELVAALDSPDPTKFLSHLPIQQDGTCNGLQHYAALGGDQAGAQQVNLEPSDRPADVYTAVAEAVKLEVEKDAKNGNSVAQKLHGRITRKCVKQPVMTNVYGVTFFGARLQVKKQLEVLFPEVMPYDPVNLDVMSHYIAVKIFKSLGEMFRGAQDIQLWLGQCADRISTCLSPTQIQKLNSQAKGSTAMPVGRPPRAKKQKAEATKQGEEKNSAKVAKREASLRPLFKTTVVWTTPLGLPVVQPYRSAKSRIIPTTMQAIALRDPQVWDPVSRRKQLQAFAPNFIHSLDATHMLLSAKKCSEHDMTFASIHDSFWTHACDVDRMNEVLRDAFVAMHSEDIIGRLREEFEQRYKGHMYLASVAADSALGKRIAKSRAATKKEAVEKGSKVPNDLAVESERLRLLNSEDPEERREGEGMNTPGSIVAAEMATSTLVSPHALEMPKIGEVPGSATGAEVAPDVQAVEPNSAEALEAVNDLEALADIDDEAEIVPEDDEEIEAAVPKAGKRARKQQQKKLYVWLPLTFPDVPAKGDFDVKRLRESRYFFH